MTSSYWSQQNFRFGSWRKDRKTTISMDGTGVFFFGLALDIDYGSSQTDTGRTRGYQEDERNTRINF